MKRILSLALIIVSALCLSACGNDKEEQTTTSAVTTTAAETSEVTAAKTEETTAEETKSGLIMKEAPEDDGLDWGDFEVVG